MDMAANLIIPFKSQRVCATCRKWKKQCDKTIPRCSRCVRKSACCDYTAPADDLILLDQIPRSYAASTANIILLRTDCCLPSLTDVGWNLLLNTACNPLNSHKEALLSLPILIRRILKASGASLVDAANKFKASIYPWFPILDPAALIRHIESSDDGNTNDGSALLVLCMHILNQTPCHHETHMASNSLYLATRRLFFLFQDAVNQSPNLELLQAGLLITLYECSHGLWNFAYLSLANCIALSQLMGLSHRDNFNSHGTTQEMACAWAVMLLDRLISLLNLDNPRPSLLPIDESRNDMGWLSWLNCPGVLDKDYRDFPEFTKLCAAAQTANNLGDALRYISLSDRDLTASLSFDLIDTSATDLISKLLLMSQTQSLHLCDTTAFAVSVLVALRFTHYLGEPQQAHIHPEILLSFHSVLNMAHDMVYTATKMTENSQIGDISFIGLVSVLRAAIHLVVAKGQSLDIRVWNEIESLLLRFSKRWFIGMQLLREFTQRKQTVWPKLSSKLTPF